MKEDRKQTLVEIIGNLYANWSEKELGMLTAARMREQLRA